MENELVNQFCWAPGRLRHYWRQAYLLIDAAWADERRIQLLRVISGQHHYAVGAVHHAVKHIQQTRLQPSSAFVHFDQLKAAWWHEDLA